MGNFVRALFSVSVMAMMPVIAGAAGTYYNGNLYQSPQSYGSNNGGYYNNYGAGRSYNQSQSMTVRNTTTRVTKKSSAKQKKNANDAKKGFQLNAYLSHEFADWDLEMKKAKSKFNYDGLSWNVLSGEGIYYFGDSTPMQIKVGARYGVQFGETSMIDDDISNGAYGSADMYGGKVSGYAVSVGTAKDGSQYGFNAAFGLTDFFKIGRVKMTPSIGYRYFKHNLKTTNTSGLTMDVYNDYCETFSGGEKQCYPLIAFSPFYDAQGNIIYVKDTNGNLLVDEDGYYVPAYIVFAGGDYYWSQIVNSIPSDTNVVNFDFGDSYYYAQPGTSHKYETLWHGPYVALDMEYEINDSNFVNAGIELGLPMYDSKGDQPYRMDWAHPTSVEDKGNFGDAYHLGLNAMWSTAISESVMFSLGLTYDYYKVSGADATTYINQSYYNGIVNNLKAYITELQEDSNVTAGTIAVYQANLAYAEDVVAHYNSIGWKTESKGEIESIYSAMGIRAGVTVKF